jgi:6-phosphogluconolactonase
MGILSMLAAALTLVGAAGSAVAAAFVYVSNADDGDIGLYTLQSDGSLIAGERFKAEKVVMPLTLSPDKKYLIAGIRSKPYQAITYSVNPASGVLKRIDAAPLEDSYPYISLDGTGRFLFGASYGGDSVAVYPFGNDGKVGAPLQVIPTARNAHSIITDRTNRYVFVPHLGTDQVFQFTFDATSGRLAANTPPLLQLPQGNGPRHIRISRDNRFLYLLNELTARLDTLALDTKTGLLKQVAAVSSLPPGSNLQPGVPAAGVGASTGNRPPRNTDHDIWASDVQLTPDERFLYTAERRNSTISVLSVDGATGKVTYVDSVPTEKQPRNFAIDPTGRFMVVSGEKSDTLSTYAIDSATGKPTLIGKYPSGKNANWVEIVSF